MRRLSADCGLYSAISRRPPATIGKAWTDLFRCLAALYHQVGVDRFGRSSAIAEGQVVSSLVGTGFAAPNRSLFNVRNWPLADIQIERLLPGRFRSFRLPG